ncbi:SDR family NAD(P)-dependent oxidoreductase [Lentibacter algarum]|uniref:SDR family NAD(P)-dependent oxidoreductase n=1 Tax=Lentibacter algarum TaxID=576131 RepID=UPI00339DA328
MSRVALIAGGAGGLGRALTAELLNEGFHVVALDLPSAALAGLEGCETVGCDMTDAAALREACEGITKAHPAIDLVIYAQGVTSLAAFEDDNERQHRRVFEVNYFASVALARNVFLAVRAAQGTHLAISSVAGFAPLVRRTAYAASKHALEGFFKSLRGEEAAHGVHVLIAAPSFVATNIGAAEASENGLTRPGSASDGIDYMSPKEAAVAIISGYKKRRKMTPIGRVARLSAWAIRIWPDFYERQMLKRINKP